MADKAILVERLSKNFEIVEKGVGFLSGVKSMIRPKHKIIKAIKDISFSIREGELVGFIGPNGAGKTTTLKMLSGLLHPSSGFASVLGFNPWDRKRGFLKQISLVMGQKNQLWWDLSAMETFELNKSIYEIPQIQYKQTLEELIDILEVKKLLNIQVRRLSLGQRMRLELIAALLHRPRVLFLDEPTIGLDVIAQQKMRDFINKYNKEFGSTVLLTSHNMEDLVNLAQDRVIVIDKGIIIFDGSFRELISNFAREKIIKAYFSKEVDFKKLEDVGRVISVSFPQATISIPREVSTIAAAELLQNFPVEDINIEEEPIENIIQKVFRGEGLPVSKKK